MTNISRQQKRHSRKSRGPRAPKLPTAPFAAGHIGLSPASGPVLDAAADALCDVLADEMAIDYLIAERLGQPIAAEADFSTAPQSGRGVKPQVKP